MTELGGLVSVVTPAYNAEHVIERAVRSVADQTVPVREHIVVDDGSSDWTPAVVARLQTEFPHVVYLHQAQLGAGPARNRGIEAASGRYIAFLDSDDYWRPRKVEQQVRFMEERGAVFSYGDYVEEDTGTGEVVSTYELPEVLGYYDLLNGCRIGCLTAAYNQEALGKRYMPAIRRGQDWALWLALTRDGTRASKYPGIEAVYSSGGGSLSSGKLRKSLDVLRIYRREEGLSPVRCLWHFARHVTYKIGK